MIFDTSTIDGLPLIWASALANPQCEGLTFGVIDGVWCGHFLDEDGSLHVALYTTGATFRRNSNAQLRLGQKAAHADIYQPLSDWRQIGPLVKALKIGVDHFNVPPTPEFWQSCASGTTTYAQADTPEKAICRCAIKLKFGETVELPDDLLIQLIRGRLDLMGKQRMFSLVEELFPVWFQEANESEMLFEQFKDELATMLLPHVQRVLN